MLTLFTLRFHHASWREVLDITLFILILRTVVISITFQKLEPRLIYLHDLDSSDSKAVLKIISANLEGIWMDHLFAIA